MLWARNRKVTGIPEAKLEYRRRLVPVDVLMGESVTFKVHQHHPGARDRFAGWCHSGKGVVIGHRMSATVGDILIDQRIVRHCPNRRMGDSHQIRGALAYEVSGIEVAQLLMTCTTCKRRNVIDVPEAGHWIARNSNLPILTIVWDNAKWAAVSTTTRALYPDGWAAKKDQFPFSDLGPSLDFELICRAAGGFAERVEDAEDVPDALQRALHSVEVEHRQALLHMVSH